MTRKIHFRRNKLIGSSLPIALCASSSSAGKVIRNSRVTYAFMASEIVGLAEFKSTPMASRCAHCQTQALEWRNRIRRQKGLAPVDNIEDWG